MTPYTTVELTEFYNLSKMKYKFSKGLKKGLIGVMLFGVPIFLVNFPTWADLTVGGVLMMLVNYLKVKYTNL